MSEPFVVVHAPTWVTRPILKLAAYLLGGAGLGFAYWYFIGCSSGSCPLTSNPYVSSAYGALVGLVSAGGWKRARRPDSAPSEADG